MSDSNKESLNCGVNLNIGKQLTETCKSVDNLTGLTKNILDFFNKQIFCDVTLISGDGELKIQAHKVILCAASNYFLAMFGGSMEEANKNEVTFKTIDGSTLQLVISYIYTSSIELTTNTVENVIIAADLLDLASLKTLCGEFIAKQLDESNCLGIALFAERYNIEELYKTAETFVCDYFTELSECEEFFKLDVDQLCKFLSSSDIRVDSEEDIVQIMLSWVNHDRSTRLELVNKLLYHIRFPLLTPEFIASTIEPICKDIKCEHLLFKAYKWHSLPEFRKSLYTDKQTELRNFNYLIMALSGFENNGGDLVVGLYNHVLNKWTYRSGIPALTFGRKMFGRITFEGKLIIAGGIIIETGEMTDRVDCLDLKTFTWTSLSPLNEKRKNIIMWPFNGCIYAVGGVGVGESSRWNIVEKYDPSESKWINVASIPNINKYTTSIELVGVRDNKLCVYLRGSTTEEVNRFSLGSTMNNSELYCHCLYDDHSNTWNCKRNWVPFRKDDSYNIVSMGKNIVRYNYLTHSTETIPNPMSNSIVKGYYECLTFVNRRIYIGNNFFLEYNISTNEWKRLANFENISENVVLIWNFC